MNRYLLCASLAVVPQSRLRQTSCEQLKSLKLADTTITLTESAGPGAFQSAGLTTHGRCAVAAGLLPRGRDA